MGRGSAGLRRRSETNDSLTSDHRGLIAGFSSLDGRSYGIGIMSINGLHMPAGRRKPGRLIIANRHIRRTIDADVIVIEKHDQF